MVNNLLVFYNDFTNKCKNEDAIFVSVGLVLPLLLFCFRISLWYTGFYTIFHPILGCATLNRIVEVIAFSYLPTFVIFCFISKKNSIFYSAIYRKISIVFIYFYIIGYIQIYFCRNVLYGFILLICSLLIYLYLLFINSAFVHFRLLLIIPYLSFASYLCKDFLERHKTVLPNYCNLYHLREKLKSEKTTRIGFAFSIFYLVLNILLYRLDLSMKDYIDLIEYRCDTSLKQIEERLNQSGNQNGKKTFIELKKEKEEIFSLKE